PIDAAYWTSNGWRPIASAVPVRRTDRARNIPRNLRRRKPVEFLNFADRCSHFRPAPCEIGNSACSGPGLGRLPCLFTSVDGDRSILAARTAALLRALATTLGRPIIKMGVVAFIDSVAFQDNRHTRFHSKPLPGDSECN